MKHLAFLVVAALALSSNAFAHDASVMLPTSQELKTKHFVCAWSDSRADLDPAKDGFTFRWEDDSEKAQSVVKNLRPDLSNDVAGVVIETKFDHCRPRSNHNKLLNFCYGGHPVKLSIKTSHGTVVKATLQEVNSSFSFGLVTRTSLTAPGVTPNSILVQTYADEEFRANGVGVNFTLKRDDFLLQPELCAAN